MARSADAPDTSSSPSAGSTAHRTWDDAPLAQEIFILNNLMMRIGDRLVAGEGLTASRWLLLGALEQYDEPPSLTELSEDALLSLQNVSRMAASMERDGLIERFTMPGRGRSVFIRLSPAGEAMCEHNKQHCEAFTARFLRDLAPDEVRQAASLLHQLIDNLEEFERDQRTES
ncbi:MAG: MarR family transcriptional regulator [Planctomycetota bacterium]